MAPYGTGSFEVMLDFEAIKQMTANRDTDKNDESQSQNYGETPDHFLSPRAPNFGETIGAPGGMTVHGGFSTYNPGPGMSDYDPSAPPTVSPTYAPINYG